MKASCQIIESCWNKERAPVDTYIMGLATSIRERNDYEEQVHILIVTCPQMQKLAINKNKCICANTVLSFFFFFSVFVHISAKNIISIHSDVIHVNFVFHTFPYILWTCTSVFTPFNLISCYCNYIHSYG